MSERQKQAAMRVAQIEAQRQAEKDKKRVLSIEEAKQLLKEQYALAEREITSMVNTKLGGTLSQQNTMADFYRIAVLEGQKDYKRTIPEEVFVGYFLPMFRDLVDETHKGELSIAEREKKLSEWIAVAGGAIYEVDVVSSTGEVLYTVPAIHNTSVINAVRPMGAPSYASIASMAQMIQMQGNARSVEYQNHKFAEKLTSTVAGIRNMSAKQAEWDSIFKRYEASKPTGTTSTSVDDDIIYD